MSQNQSKKRSPSVLETNTSTLEQVKLLVAAGEYSRALKLVQIPGPDIALKNAKGVCLLRLGQYAAAVSLFREIVFKAGCVWVRPDAPTCCKVNFATSLLLTGNMEGGIDVLREAVDESFPAVQRLRMCLRRWKSHFPLWKKIVWALGLGPANQAPFTLDFQPGIFEDGQVDELAPLTEAA